MFCLNYDLKQGTSSSFFNSKLKCVSTSCLKLTIVSFKCKLNVLFKL